MSEWDRNNPLRQGMAIHHSQLPAATPEPAWEWAVVVSHDCDLANEDLEREPLVEMVPATALEQPDGNHQHARNPRELHLPLLDDFERQLGWYRLCAPQKFALAKSSLVDIAMPRVRVDPKHHHTLQDWLAARYRRHALPEELINRLRDVMSFLGKRLKKNGEEIIGLWLGYDPRDELETGNPYEVDLYIVYSVEAESAADAAEALVDDIHRHLAKAKDIEVRECFALSEQAFTLYDLRTTELLRYEYISNRIGPEAPRAD